MFMFIVLLTYLSYRRAKSPNENKISHDWREQAWFAMDVFS
jgi:hypothetical protein